MNSDEKAKLASEILKTKTDDLVKSSKELPNDNATYFWQPERGGGSVLIADDGSFLCFGSSLSLEQALQEFKNGKRTNNTKTN